MTERVTISPELIQVELERIWQLHPETVIVGLSQPLENRLVALATKHKKTPQEEYLESIYYAVSSLLDPMELDLSKINDEYKSAVEGAIRYMSFIGFPKHQLTAEGIVAAENRLNKKLIKMSERSRLRDFEFWKLSKGIPVPGIARQRLEYRIKNTETENRLREMGIDLAREDELTLMFLDSEMRKYKHLRPLKRVITLELDKLGIRCWEDYLDFYGLLVETEEKLKADTTHITTSEVS